MYPVEFSTNLKNNSVVINPTVDQVKEVVGAALRTLGTMNYNATSIAPMKRGTDVQFMGFIQIFRPYDQHGCRNPRVSLNEYRKFFRKVDALCVYLEENLTMSEELTVKEIQNDIKDQDPFHSVCICITTTVSNLPADAPVN